jgi:hypothetical protein
LIAPCLNPVGLTLNTRADHRGIDINRRFHDAEDVICGPWQRWITEKAMRFGLCLHEDYDAQGIYLYELNHARETAGHGIIEQCSRVIAPDPRTNIDGQRAKGGVIRRRTLPTHLPGMPEAIELHQRGCPLTLTFETPSEFDLDTRVRAQCKLHQGGDGGASRVMRLLWIMIVLALAGCCDVQALRRSSGAERGPTGSVTMAKRCHGSRGPCRRERSRAAWSSPCMA